MARISRMRGVISVIRERDRSKPIQPLYSTLRSVNSPHLFFVQPGRHEFHNSFEAPFDGSIHFIGTHIHPHGVTLELYDVTRDRLVWRRQQLDRVAAKLSQLSPLLILDRGYAIVSGPSGIVKDNAQAPSGSPIHVRLAKGTLDAVVERSEPS